VAGIQRGECSRPEINLFSDISFTSLGAILYAVMKERTAEGLDIVKHTDNLTTEDENTLWETGLLTKTLSYGVMIFFF
jgi:hypothetical protein